eukprot:Gregarina_sp_Pseudo_9__1834@NODE_224_length_3530_cov_15_940132_g208_i0_p3_GENE_NODE_224_length_3530_cov_15_940132_g208_i0NODE_224_length_3530_cov_15_940132_g208_i0_p3_ORF_typecomplete_len184_score3_00SPC22/PF04573_12/4_6e24DUF2683/PF10884_8/0_26_NODE_224_length_3530_cov_15_940132_g208_i029133464
MDCVFTRLSNLVSLYVLSLFLCGFYNYITSYLLFTPKSWPVNEFKVTPRQVTLHPGLRADQMNFGLKSQVDLSDTFHWGARQSFLFLYAEYETPTRPRNQVVVWDGIARRKEQAVLNITKTKYQLKDYGRGYLKKSGFGNEIALPVPAEGRPISLPRHSCFRGSESKAVNVCECKTPFFGGRN